MYKRRYSNMRYRVHIICFMLILPAFLLQAKQNFDEYPSRRYIILSEVSEQDSQEISRKMEILYRFFNQFFHFPDPGAREKLRVRIYRNRMSYNNYLLSLINTTRNGFTYLHYGLPQRNELVGFISEDENVQKTLIRQAFIQFIRYALPNTPAWIREGFAMYFENIKITTNYNKLKVTYKQSENWAELVRKIMQRTSDRLPITINTLLRADKAYIEQYADTFYPLAWGLVSFLIEIKEKQYNRFLWEALADMKKKNSYEENVNAILQHALIWLDQKKMGQDFLSFLKNINTFQSLIDKGILLYQQKNMDEALQIFQKANTREPSNFTPYYYQGIIYYNLGDYIKAEQLLIKAKNRGLQQDLANYAFGLNAHAQGDREKAIRYLKLIPLESMYFAQGEQLLTELQQTP